MRVAFFPMLIAVFAMSTAALSGCAPADIVQDDELDASTPDGAAEEQTSKAQGCDDRCSPSCPCEEGQGDCDTDRDCAEGLMCPPDGTGIERKRPREEQFS